MFMTAKSKLIKRFRERFSPEPVIKIVQDTDGHASRQTGDQLGCILQCTRR